MIEQLRTDDSVDVRFKINELVGIVNDIIHEFSAMGIEIYDTTKQNVPIKHEHTEDCPCGDKIDLTYREALTRIASHNCGWCSASSIAKDILKRVSGKI